MKKIFSIILLLAIFSVVKAQGNLQFNRVFLVEHSFIVPINILGPFSEISFTVPAGKVWKVESVMANLYNSNGSLSTSMAVMINNKSLYHIGVMASFPIWLPEGTYTLRLAYTSNTGLTNNTAYGGISGIEFNVIP